MKRIGRLFSVLFIVFDCIGMLIPAVLLLVLHFTLGISIWWFVGLMILWIATVILGSLILNWASICSNEQKTHRDNKNRYSKKNSEMFPKAD
ncbi:MAG: hypothetical protein IJO93_03645 [Clostridia bacterium]|nr:hypothetical protein [Clostridia bacterium]